MDRYCVDCNCINFRIGSNKEIKYFWIITTEINNILYGRSGNVCFDDKTKKKPNNKKNISATKIKRKFSLLILLLRISNT